MDEKGFVGAAIAAIFLVAMSVPTTALVVDAVDVQPDSPLYGLERLGEGMKRPSPWTRTNFDLGICEERMQESAYMGITRRDAQWARETLLAVASKLEDLKARYEAKHENRTLVGLAIARDMLLRVVELLLCDNVFAPQDKERICNMVPPITLYPENVEVTPLAQKAIEVEVEGYIDRVEASTFTVGTHVLRDGTGRVRFLLRSDVVDLDAYIGRACVRGVVSPEVTIPPLLEVTSARRR